VAPSPAGQDPDKATGLYLGTATVTLSSPQKSTPFCEENRRDVLTFNQGVAGSIPAALTKNPKKNRNLNEGLKD
jgi:hypothetical protein